MDFQSVMESFAEAFVAANTQTPLTEAAEAQQSLCNIVSGRSSIPLHTIVERISSPTCLTGNINSSNPSNTTSSPTTPTTSTTSCPATSSNLDASPPASVISNCSSTIEQDTFAIIASNVAFVDVVRTALLKLGYSASEAVSAKGVIQLKNWKTLTFEQITDNSEATVGDILGDISSSVTLRIRLYRQSTNAAHELKDKLLQVLLAHSYSLLINSDCPIDKQILTGLCRGRVEQDITDETRRRFDQWYLQQIFNHYRQIALAAQQPTSRRSSIHPLLSDLNLNAANLDLSHGTNENGQNHCAEKHPALMTISPQQNQHQLNVNVRTRIRTSFDPELELPKLHQWFAENRHPSRAQVQEYVRELNSLESRKGRKPLDVNNVVYWFKNARAAHKRAELKFVGGDSNNNSGGDNLTNGSQSPSKSNSDICGKGSEDLMKNGSGLDDYYSLDEDCESSRDAAQTLDLSMRAAKRNRSESPSPTSNDLSLNSFKTEDEAICESNQTKSNKFELKHEAFDGSNSDCNSMDADESEEEKDFFDNGNGAFQKGINSHNSSSNFSNHPESPEGRRIRRSRTFIDPMSEVPRLENWFSMNTHPAHSQIVRYTEELNNLPYRQKFPKLEPKNIQFWFKNRRAKYKRLTLPSTASINPSSSLNIERLIAH